MRSDRRVVHQVASWCLAYPDDEVVSRIPLLVAAVDEQPRDETTSLLARFLTHVTSIPVDGWRQEYVDTFDLSRKHALYLSYWTDGDTRQRGEVLARLKQRYRASGLLVRLGGELPDFLPLVLEYSATVDSAEGVGLLQSYRPSLELLRLALADAGSCFADVLTAICTTLPGASPTDRAAVMAMAAAGPPTETVGLEPYDPRLLPLTEVR